MKTILSAFSLLAFISVPFFIHPVIEWEKEQQFIECSKNEGDLGCDSCYYLIYGEYIDTYSLFTDSIQTY